MMNISSIGEYSLRYKSWFIRGVHDNTAKSGAYMQGLFSYGKSNIERMAEQLPINEQPLHHFMNVCDWDAKGVMGQVAGQIQTIFQESKQAKGLLIDERFPNVVYPVSSDSGTGLFVITLLWELAQGTLQPLSSTMPLEMPSFDSQFSSNPLPKPSIISIKHRTSCLFMAYFEH